jgi:RNA polymerase sigma factor (sigma-70 family)
VETITHTDASDRTQSSDPLLAPYLESVGEEQARAALERVVGEHAGPVIRGVIRARLAGFRDAAGAGPDAEDIYNDAITQLITRLNELRAAGTPTAAHVGDLSSYAAVVAHNAFHAHLRHKFPRRWRLKNRLRYLLRNRPDLALWQAAGGEWLCGRAEAQRESGTRPAGLERLQALRDDPGALERCGLRESDPGTTPLAELVPAVFEWAGGAVEFDALVSVVAGLQGVTDEALAADESEAQELQDERADVGDALERRQFFARLWEEVCALPVRQRAALLLNLRDLQENVITLLPALGVASIRAISDALEIPYDEFLRLWNELPLDDAAIAERLGLTRQQVINLRKSARARLARRMRGLL